MKRAAVQAMLAFGALALVLAMRSPASAGASPAVKCAVGKKKAACKKVCCELGIKVKGGTDISKCTGSFSKVFGKLEAKGGCSTSADEGAIEAKVDAFVTDALSELKPVTNKCEVSKLKAACKKVCCELGLDAKAELTGGTDDEAVDFSKCRGKFSATFAKAEAGKGGCATSADTGAIEHKVDAFVDDVIDELTEPPTPTCANGGIPCGAPCGTCGGGFCQGPAGSSCPDVNCTDTQPVCIASSSITIQACTIDAQCGPGRICGAASPPQCGTGGGNGCGTPCPE